jgi:hypothetical protein
LERHRRHEEEDEGEDAKTTLYCTGLAVDTLQSDLFRAFKHYGYIRASRVGINPQNGKCRGFGFVDFEKAAAAKRAYGNGEIMIRGVRVTLKLQAPRNANQYDKTMYSSSVTTERGVKRAFDKWLPPPPPPSSAPKAAAAGPPSIPVTKLTPPPPPPPPSPSPSPALTQQQQLQHKIEELRSQQQKQPPTPPPPPKPVAGPPAALAPWQPLSQLPAHQDFLKKLAEVKKLFHNPSTEPDDKTQDDVAQPPPAKRARLLEPGEISPSEVIVKQEKGHDERYDYYYH